MRVDVSALLSLPDAEEGVLRDMLVANLQLRQNAGAAVMQLVDGAERPDQPERARRSIADFAGMHLIRV